MARVLWVRDGRPGHWWATLTVSLSSTRGKSSPLQGFQGKNAQLHTHCCTLARDCRRGQGRSPLTAKGTAEVSLRGPNHPIKPNSSHSSHTKERDPRVVPGCLELEPHLRGPSAGHLRRGVKVQARLHANAGKQPGAQPCPAGAAAPAAGCRRGLGPQVRWAAGRPARSGGLRLQRPGRRLSAPPGRCSRAALALRWLSPLRRAHLPARPAGLPLCRGFGRGRLADRPRSPGRAGRLGALRPLRAPLPPPGPGAAKPLRLARRPLAAGGRARAPLPAPRPRRPHLGLARPRCGAARRSGRGRLPTAAQPGLEGPGPGAEPSPRAARAAPRRPTCRPGRAGRGLVLSARRLGDSEPRWAQSGAPPPGTEVWPASPTYAGARRAPPAEGTAPGDGGLGRGRRTAAPSVRPARQRGKVAGPRPAALGPGTAGAWGAPARSQGALPRGRRSWNWVGRPDTELCETAQEGPGKAFPESGSHRNGGCGDSGCAAGPGLPRLPLRPLRCLRAPAPPDLRRPGVPLQLPL